MGSATAAESIRLHLMMGAGDGDKRNAYETLFRAFREQHPNIEIIYDVQIAERTKSDINAIVGSGKYDLVQWFAGRALEDLVDRDLLRPLDDLKPNLAELSEQAIAVSTIEQQLFGMPFSYYEWGLWYSKKALAGNAPPQSWPEFLAFLELQQNQGVTPIALGSRDNWTLGGWFDYLNLRENGADFHRSLLNGDIPFNDLRVARVFEHIRTIRPYIDPDHPNLLWRDSAILIKRHRAAVGLYGAFFLTEVPGHLINDVVFARFPAINPKVGVAEEAPTDVLVVPKDAKSPINALLFLKFFAQADRQGEFNAALGQLPVNRHSKLIEGQFRKEALQILATSSTLTQFLDRDIRPDLKQPLFNALEQFFKDPDQLRPILEQLETLRLKS